MVPEPGDVMALDALAGEFQARGGQPGLAYGIVAGGVGAGGGLVHSRGFGGRWIGGPVPDADTVFRIASMTKSFTAAAVLALRDRGALALDDPAQEHVPELSGLGEATADSPPITIRHLLTMTAGFPTDDPWGDRQQGMPAAEFSAFLAGGVSCAWAPGTQFEYSNLGYAILGRVIAAVAGTGYPEFVREHLLSPLGLSSTGFEAAEFPAAGLARGYHRDGAGWAEVVPDACGAFAPMGGVFSSVRDLAGWVSGFAAAFPPGGQDAGGPHPLRRAARREMQLPQVAVPAQGQIRLPGDPGGGPASYGLGLFIEEDPAWGRIVQHSGGYPGFGSHMRWHPATGLGVIVLANSTYAGAGTLGAALLDTLLRRQRRAPRSRAPLSPAGPWPQALQAQQAVHRLLLSWDDATASTLFSENAALDEPFSQRRRNAGLIRDRIGDFAEDPRRPAEFDSPARCRWWLSGERGVAQAEIELTPERSPRVMSLTLAVPPAAGSALDRLLNELMSILNATSTDWPAAVRVSGAVNTPLLTRQFRMAAAWAGSPCRGVAFLAGDGESSVTVEVAGPAGSLTLAVQADPAGLLRQAGITLLP